MWPVSWTWQASSFPADQMARTPPASMWRKVFEGTREINTLIGRAIPGPSAFP